MSLSQGTNTAETVRAVETRRATAAGAECVTSLQRRAGERSLARTLFSRVTETEQSISVFRTTSIQVMKMPLHAQQPRIAYHHLYKHHVLTCTSVSSLAGTKESLKSFMT